MLSHRQQSVNQYVNVTSQDFPSDIDDEIDIAVDNTYRQRTNHHVASAASSNIKLAGSLNSSHSSTSSTFAPTNHRCCCLTFRATPTRRLHLAFLKALGITFGCLAFIFLVGMILEPLMMDKDGWMDCVDVECSVVVPRQSTRFMHVEVDPQQSLLLSAYHKTDPSEKHAISNPEFFAEWHERTVNDFLERQQRRADKLAEFIKPANGHDALPADIRKTLYQSRDASIHTDVSRTREIYDAEKMQLEKAYINLVPWLPHHMRLGPTPDEPKENESKVQTKTTAPLLSRKMLDDTTAYLTEHYPTCMWIRLWIVDSTIYVHSYNTRRGGNDSPSPSSVFGSESARLNHFLMMILHVLSSTMSTRLQADLQYFDLPPQPEAAAGREDLFPNLDAIFQIGDSPCGNMTRVVDNYQHLMSELTKANLEHQKRRGSVTIELQLSEDIVMPTDDTVMLQTDELISESVDPSPSIESKKPTIPLPLSPPSIHPADVLSAPTEVEPPTPKANPMFESILSFQNGYNDENTRALLLLPRTLDVELSRREKILSDIRRGKYPVPPSHFAPVFAIRQPAAAVAPPPAMQSAQHSPYYSLFNYLFGEHQQLLSSPNILLPDFTRWSQLIAMEEESLTDASGLIAPASLSVADRSIREEGGLEEDVADVADQFESSTLNPSEHAAGEPVPLIHAMKLHQLHNKQIAQLRGTQKMMLVLSPLSGPNLAQQLKLQEDELEVEGLKNLNMKDIHNLESASRPGTPASKKQLSLQQRMLRKFHILLKHRLVHVHDFNNATTPEQKARLKLEGAGILHDIMEFVNRQYASYEPLTEQREFEEKYGTGFKLYDSNSIVPTSCHLPFVVYEERAVDARSDGTVPTPPGGNVEPASGGTIRPLPGGWAHWLWTCDYLVMREVRTMPRPRTPLDEKEEMERLKEEAQREAEDVAEAEEKKDKSKRKRRGKKQQESSTTKKKKKAKARGKKELPPLILPSVNSFDEFWSATYEPYKHYLPFTLTMSPDDIDAIVQPTEEERRAAETLEKLHTAPPSSNTILPKANQPVLAQLQSSLRSRLLEASVPGAYSTSAKVLHLFTLLHQVTATDWTLRLHPHHSHSHEILNAHARKKGLHEEGSEHEDAAKAELAKLAPKVHQAGDEDSMNESDSPMRSWSERHSCSSHFKTLADSLSCVWCVRVSSRHWMRTVMAPEYIASYMRKLLTLYSHSLSNVPSTAEFDSDPSLRHRLTKIKTQSEVREFIKQLVFTSHDGSEE